MPLCIRNLKPFRKNTLRAFFDVELPSGMVICGCMLHDFEGTRWVGLPAKPYTKDDGSQSWAKIVGFVDQDKAMAFKDLVMPAASAALDEVEAAA